jgi:DNA-binding NtrC family response regulator
VTLTVPPLRERTDEIPALAATFIAAACRDAGRPPLSLSVEVMELLLRHRWPGNIRELKNVMERAVALCDGEMILPDHLPLEKMGEAIDPFETQNMAKAKGAPVERSERATIPANPAKVAERQRILDALAACNGNQTRAALLLNMPRRTFVSKLDQYALPRPQKGSTPRPGPGKPVE